MGKLSKAVNSSSSSIVEDTFFSSSSDLKAKLFILIGELEEPELTAFLVLAESFYSLKKLSSGELNSGQSLPTNYRKKGETV